MITQIKKWGDSKVLVLSPEVCKYHDLEIGDWVDIADIVKLKEKKNLNLTKLLEEQKHGRTKN